MQKVVTNGLKIDLHIVMVWTCEISMLTILVP